MVQDLVLKILVELSGDRLKDVKDLRNHMIRIAMVDSDITSKLFEVVDSRRPCTQESLKSVLILLRNLSLAGTFSLQLLDCFIFQHKNHTGPKHESNLLRQACCLCDLVSYLITSTPERSYGAPHFIH